MGSAASTCPKPHRRGNEIHATPVAGRAVRRATTTWPTVGASPDPPRADDPPSKHELSVAGCQRSALQAAEIHSLDHRRGEPAVPTCRIVVPSKITDALRRRHRSSPPGLPGPAPLVLSLLLNGPLGKGFHL